MSVGHEQEALAERGGCGLHLVHPGLLHDLRRDRVAHPGRPDGVGRVQMLHQLAHRDAQREHLALQSKIVVAQVVLLGREHRREGSGGYPAPHQGIVASSVALNKGAAT